MNKQIKSLLKNVKIEEIFIRTADGIGTSTSDAVDMADYEGGMFIIPIGVSAATGAVTARLEQSSDDGVVDSYGGVAGSAVAATGKDDTLLVIDLAKASKRYVKVITVTSVANSEIGPVLAFKYGPRYAPVTQEAADVSASVLLAGPEEGTP